MQPIRASLQVGVALAGVVVPVGALVIYGEDGVSFSGAEHFVFVSFGAAVAMAAAVIVSFIGLRQRDGRSVAIGAGFSVMAALLVLHGVATPGVVFDQNGVIALAGGITIPAGVAAFALAALPQAGRPEAARRIFVIEVGLLVAVVALGASALIDPALVPDVPTAHSDAASALLVFGLALLALVGRRAYRTWRLTHRSRDLTVVVGLAWLAGALWAAMTTTWMQAAWWLGHGYEMVGIMLVAGPALLDLMSRSPSRSLQGDVRAAALVRAEEAYLGAQVRALTRRLAEKDVSTEHHVRKVALLAVAVGEDLGLPPGHLRQLATGALLHDMGKLNVPDEILKKPGSLDDAEFAVVRQHPAWGDDLLRTLGFGDVVLRLVRGHHERLDGSGYPDGLAGETIPLDVRILAVCDVYDALVSARAYRPAWSVERALALLEEGRGSAYCARCIDALRRVVGADAALAA